MNSILTPVLLLVVLSLVLAALVLVTRLPAVARSHLTMDDVRFPEALKTLPASVRQVADNYNHLMEQPTIFYALVFYIALSGHSDPLHIALAWAYAGLRVVHSIIQCTVNAIVLRLPVFIASTGVLAAMACREVAALF